MRTSCKMSAASGNFSFLGGPFLMPVHTSTGSSDLVFLTEISNDPLRGVRPSLITSSNWWFGASEHKSVKICVARRLKTCQDLQASTDTMYLFFFEVGTGTIGDSVTNSGISAVNFAWNQRNHKISCWYTLDVYLFWTYVTFSSSSCLFCLLVLLCYCFFYLNGE